MCKTNLESKCLNSHLKKNHIQEYMFNLYNHEDSNIHEHKKTSNLPLPSSHDRPYTHGDVTYIFTKGHQFKIRYFIIILEVNFIINPIFFSK